MTLVKQLIPGKNINGSSGFRPYPRMASPGRGRRLQVREAMEAGLADIRRRWNAMFSAKSVIFRKFYHACQEENNTICTLSEDH